MAFLYNPNKTSPLIIYGYSGGYGNYTGYMPETNSPYVFTVFGDANFKGRIFLDGVPFLTQNDTNLLNPMFGSGTMGLADSGHLEISGSNLQNQIFSIYNETGTFYKKSNPENYIKSGDVNTKLVGLISTGSADLRYVTGISITGGLGIKGPLNINAGANIVLTQQGTNTVSIASTAAGGGVLGGVTGLSITGGLAISGAIGYFGGGDIRIIQSGNSIVVSGSSSAPGAGEANTATNIGIGSGIFSGKVGVDLKFKTILAGDGIALNGDAEEFVISSRPLWFQYTVGSVTYTNMATGQTFFANSSAYIIPVNLSSFTGVNLVINKVGTAGQPLSFLFLGYNNTFSTTATVYRPLVTSHPKSRIDVTNTIINSGWFPIEAAARTNTFLALLASGSNGVLDPVFGAIIAYFK